MALEPRQILVIAALDRSPSLIVVLLFRIDRSPSARCFPSLVCTSAVMWSDPLSCLLFALLALPQEVSCTCLHRRLPRKTRWAKKMGEAVFLTQHGRLWKKYAVVGVRRHAWR